MNTVSAFLCPSHGMGLSSCSDRLAVSSSCGRFCVADGVSGSHLGGLWAGLLCLDFVTEKAPATQWAQDVDDERKCVLTELWEEDCEEMESSCPQEHLRRLLRTRAYYGHGASTMAGVTMSDGLLHYSIIGDSCLWLKNMDGEVRCLPAGIDITDISEAVTSDWCFFPSPDRGSIPLEDGSVIVLATDALSDWIGRLTSAGVDAIGMLAGLESKEDFLALVACYRDAPEAQRLKDDDVGVIIIRMDDSSDMRCEVSHVDRAVRLDAPLMIL